MLELLKLVGTGLIILLPLANPLSTVAIFLGLSSKMTEGERNHQAKMTAIYVFFIMVVAWYAGQLILKTFGISIPGLRIAGGLIVCTIGFNMLFPKTTDTNTSGDIAQDNNIAFVPLAMPMTAGPGAIALIISTAATIEQVSQPSSWAFWVAPLLVFVIIAWITWFCLKSATRIVRFLGSGGIDSIARLMGFILVCMGVQFIINGGMEIYSTLPH